MSALLLRWGEGSILEVKSRLSIAIAEAWILVAWTWDQISDPLFKTHMALHNFCPRFESKIPIYLYGFSSAMTSFILLHPFCLQYHPRTFTYTVFSTWNIRAERGHCD